MPPATAPSVTFKLPDGVETQVRPGAVIGRLVDAGLFIDDPRVSEAHAMVSLRAGKLVLLALRGTLKVGRERMARLVLSPGQVIEIVNGVKLRVTDVVLPGSFLAILVDEHPAQALERSVYSLKGDALLAGLDPEADAHIWATAEGWRIRVGAADAQCLRAGSVIEIGEHTARVIEQRPDQVGVNSTIDSAGLDGVLTIVTRFETVHVHGPRGRSVLVPGIAARMVSELASFGAPVPWEMVASTIWKDSDAYVQRRNWDRHLALLRSKLRKAGLRDDLVCPDGRGNVELFLRPGDTLQDEG